MRPGLNAVYHSFSLFNRDFSVRAVRVSELVQILSPACRVANAVENEHLDFARKLQGVDDQRISDVYKGFVSSLSAIMDLMLGRWHEKLKGDKRGLEMIPVGPVEEGPWYADEGEFSDEFPLDANVFVW